MIPLIDSDSIIYRSCSEDLEQACANTDYYISKIEDKFGCLGIIVLGGEGNFRHLIDPNYKISRKDKPKPENYYEVKDYFIKRYEPVIVDGYEAEDYVGSIHKIEENVICGIDKDLDTIPGWHFNYVKDTYYEVTNDQAAYNFYLQILVGDSTDNVKGIKGVGKVKATKLLEGLNVSEYKEAVVNKYLEVYGDQGLIEFDKTARLIFIKRESLTSEYFNYY